MGQSNSRSSLREWEMIFEALSANLHDLERIVDDPGTAENIREMAVSQLAEAKQNLAEMTMSRGHILTDG